MIKEDKSYLTMVDRLAIEKGFAKLDIFSIRIDREDFTEEEKEENARIANSLSSEEFSKRCNETKKRTALKVEPLIESLSTKFDIYQYKDNERSSYNRNWDLFFWCNCDKEGRDFSYITLNTNEKRTLEERFSDVEKVTSYIKEVGFDGIDVSIQYTTKYDDEKIKKVVDRYINKIKSSFVEYRGNDGRIKEVQPDNETNKCYGFFKKGARTKYWELSNIDILMMALQTA